jgi:hypothetical protein
MRKLQIAALVMFCIGAPVALWEGMRLIPGARADSPAVSYPELVAILLTGITVALAMLAVVIGIFAIWGYSNIKQEATTAANAAVESTVKVALERHLNDQALGGTIRKELRPVVQEVVREVLPDLTSGLYSAAFPQGDAGEVGSQRIAEELPRDQNEAR